jgi:amino acid transporter
VVATVLLVAVFAVVSTAAPSFADPGFLGRHSSDVLGAMSSAVLGGRAGWLLVLCVLTSAAASTQTRIMPTARAVLAMAAHRALPSVFARMHPRFRTPAFATVAMGAVSAVFFVLLTAVSANVLADSASSVGPLIAFYYGLTGFACAWFFRRELLSGLHPFLVKGLALVAGGIALLVAFILSIRSYWLASSSYSSFAGVGGVFLIGAGSLVTGVLLLLAARWRMPYFFGHGITTPAGGGRDTGHATHD